MQNKTWKKSVLKKFKKCKHAKDTICKSATNAKMQKNKKKHAKYAVMQKSKKWKIEKI